MDQVYGKFGLEPGTKDFIGHAMALYLDDAYLHKPAREAIERIVLYVNSMARYGKSPYIYPLYGLGELPQGFARLSAIFGGTYMLDKKVDEIVYENGVAIGVRSGEEVAKAPIIVGDPSYFPGKVRRIGKVIRAICLLQHPIPNTDNADSVQLIIPQNQVARRHGEMYLHSVAYSRYLHCGSVFCAQCLREKSLSCDRLYNRRNRQSPNRNQTRPRPPWPNPREVSSLLTA